MGIVCVRAKRTGCAILTVLAVAACVPSAPAPRRVAAFVPEVLPPGMRAPAALPQVTPSTCDPRASSLRPREALPAPGRMPSGSTMERILRRGYLTAGVDQNLNLLGFREPKTGELAGYDIDFVREIARAIFGDPAKVKFRTVTSENRIKVLEKGEIDIIADSMTINCERLQQVLFTTVYFEAGQRVMIREGEPYRSIDDLGGKRVCAPAGTTSIRTIAESKSRPIPVSVVDWTDCVLLLQQGQVDAISTTDGILVGLLAQDPTTVMVGPRFTDEPHGLAIAKTAPDFVRFVNAVLEQMRGDGRWRSIYAKWLTTLGPVPEPPPARYLNE
ncbi:glutamate ABC transporter substrate-binding protein [Amycolatopsis samaneae]|uniref:Glutamate ABC transporter substrate-binding protein n=1 Tax=Amycolatopsis samaneae TaxID=664691 RepID=A0ABW5GS53_9PSEU